MAGRPQDPAFRHDQRLSSSPGGAASAAPPGAVLSGYGKILEVRGIGMRFGRQTVLRGVSLAFEPGMVHGLVGHNGSGKSTLIRVLAGYHQPTAGSILLGGRPADLGSTTRAFQLGLRFVHQDLGLVGQFTALENFGLGAGYSKTRRGTVDWAHQRRRLAVAQMMLESDFPSDRPVSEFRPVQRTFLAIARAIAPADDGEQARFVMLDEPTTALERPEAEQLFAVIRRLADQGVGVLYVSHQLDDVLQLCRTVSILRDGSLVETVSGAEASRDELVTAMLGEEAAGDLSSAVDERVPTAPVRRGPPVLSITGLRSPRLRDVSFTVHPGECVCAVGLSGSGREELIYAVAGALPVEVDRVEIDGQLVDALDPAECRRRGIAVVPGNRLPGSLVNDFTVQENLSFVSLPKVAGMGGIIRPGRERRLAQACIERFDIRPPDPQYRCRYLSGGNKQKVILAKWLSIDPALLLIDEPTAGVDVGAARNLLTALRSLTGEGKALLISTSEVSDVLEIADRVLVLNQGQIVATLNRQEDEWSESGLVGAMSRTS